MDSSPQADTSAAGVGLAARPGVGARITCDDGPRAGSGRQASAARLTGCSTDPLLAELAELYECEFGRFSRVAAAITGDIESARDVVQDAFASLVRQRREHRPDASLAGWTWRAVVNTARSHRRAERYANDALERMADNVRLIELGAPASDDAERVLSLIRGLPERQRTIVFLRYYADLDYASIGEALSIRIGTVSAALNAAHAAVRAGLHVPTG